MPDGTAGASGLSKPEGLPSRTMRKRSLSKTPTTMNLVLDLPPIAAIGYSIVYMLFGGGLFGAGVIFVIAKMLGK